MQLRKHQKDAVAATNLSLSAGHNPAVQMATGTGKSLVIADLILTYEHDCVWVLTHSQELVKQNAEAYHKHTGDHPGIVCAGLNRADFNTRVMFGTIQSVINPALKGLMRTPDLIIIDEAHRVNHKTGEASTYGKVFERFSQARRVGMTATPWRMDDGLIYGKGENFWFDERCFKYTAPQGVADGWLSPLVGVETETQLDLEEVSVGDDYNNTEVSKLQTNGWLGSCALTIGALAATRKHIAVYCPTVTAAMRAAAVIAQATGWSTGVLTGAMSRGERRDVLKGFTSGAVRVLCSVDTLTTGFNFPAMDCVVCLRPTLSSSLWVQILGRGTRIAAGKKNCLVLDFVGNLQRLGGVDMLETYVRERGGVASEPLMAEPAPPREPRKMLPGVTTLIPLDPTSGQQAVDGATLTVQVHAVSAVAITTRRDPNHPVLLVQYVCTTPENARINASAFITTARENPEAAEFFKARNLAVILPAEARKLMWQMKGAKLPSAVTAKKSGKYWNVVAEHF